MTPVIGQATPLSYARRMRQPPSAPTLAALLREQRELEGRICARDLTMEDTLAAGRLLLAFAEREGDAFRALAPLLDPVAQAELADEHRQIAEDLALLEWLLAADHEAADAAVLSASLASRMRHHIARDGRLLSRAATLARG
jgi:hypothetical protein